MKSSFYSNAVHARTTRTRRASRGLTLVYVTVAMVALSGFISLGVDFGRVQIVKAQLRSATDAAALAAGASLNRGEANATAINYAISTAAANNADGSPVVLTAADVTLGHWNNGTCKFEPGNTPTDAVKITAHRTAGRGSAVPLLFGSMIGMLNCDASASSVARANDHVPTQAFVGLDYFAARGLLITDSYSAGQQGSVASNGDIKLNLLGLIGLTWIDGDCTPGIGGAIYKPAIGVTKVTGSQAQLAEAIVATPVDASYYATHNDNANLPSSMLSSSNDFTIVLVADIPAGNYYVRNLTTIAGALVRINGAAKFYVTGAVTMAANIIVFNGDPKNFKVNVSGSGAVTMIAALNTSMTLYAPQSSLNIVAGGMYTGSFVAKTVDILATTYLHYSEALVGDVPTRGATLVD